MLISGSTSKSRIPSSPRSYLFIYFRFFTLKKLGFPQWFPSLYSNYTYERFIVFIITGTGSNECFFDFCINEKSGKKRFLLSSNHCVQLYTFKIRNVQNVLSIYYQLSFCHKVQMLPQIYIYFCMVCFAVLHVNARII